MPHFLLLFVRFAFCVLTDYALTADLWSQSHCSISFVSQLIDYSLKLIFSPFLNLDLVDLILALNLHVHAGNVAFRLSPMIYYKI